MKLPSTITKKESLKFFWKAYPYKTTVEVPWAIPDYPIFHNSYIESNDEMLNYAYSIRSVKSERKLFIQNNIDIHCPKSNWFSRAIGIFGSGVSSIKKISYFFMFERPFTYFVNKNQEYISEYFVPSKTLLSKGVQADTIEYRKSLYNNEYQWRVEIKKTKNSRDHFTDIKNMENLLFRENKNTYTIFTNEESNLVYLKLGHQADNITKITKAELI